MEEGEEEKEGSQLGCRRGSGLVRVLNEHLPSWFLELVQLTAQWLLQQVALDESCCQYVTSWDLGVINALNSFPVSTFPLRAI